jgi:hypothetical protein
VWFGRKPKLTPHQQQEARQREAPLPAYDDVVERYVLEMIMVTKTGTPRASEPVG